MSEAEIELTEPAEEILADLWVAAEEKHEPSLPASAPAREGAEEALRELAARGLVECRSDRLSLTDAGRREAASIVRRERLAERLLVDVLALPEAAAAETACKFEHLLRRGIDDEICTLLGHPRVCPHGSPIPPGECCRAGAHAAGKVVSALADLAPGQKGAIAYLHSRRREIMQKLLAMGLVPGAPIALLQRSPSYVFQLGQAQIAVDYDTARDIYVRLTGASNETAPPRPHRGFRFRRGRRKV